MSEMNEALNGMEKRAVHAVVQLLVKRMESNPEEFTETRGRWDRYIAKVREHGTHEDVSALEEKLSQLNMDALHQSVLEELLGTNDATKQSLTEEALARAIRSAQHASQLQQMQAYHQLQNNQWSNPGTLSGLLGVKGPFK